MRKVRGTQPQVKPIEVGTDTVYVRTNIESIIDKESDFTGWEYDEETYPLKEYVENLTHQEDSSAMAIILTSLMDEISDLSFKIKTLQESVGGANDE